MTLTPKESSLIKDLRAQEQLCVDKYTKYANDARDGQLKNLFSQISQIESGHIQTLDQIASGTVPQMNGGSTQPPTIQESNSSAADRQADTYLCSDAIATEKHASSMYNTCIFEFTDPGVRNVLNHIQKEEQQHGEWIYSYMSKNGMYS